MKVWFLDGEKYRSSSQRYFFVYFFLSLFLEISLNSLENTWVRVSFLIKLQAWGLRPATLLKKRLWHRCFPVNFVNFLRTSNSSWRLFLQFLPNGKSCWFFHITLEAFVPPSLTMINYRANFISWITA